jgi:hypothetical protein
MMISRRSCSFRSLVAGTGKARPGVAIDHSAMAVRTACLSYGTSHVGLTQCGVSHNPAMPDSESGREQKARALRKRGWGEAKIERWLDEQRTVAAREKRVHPPPPWADEMSLEAEEQLLTKHRGAAWGENWFYRQTALEIVDEAEEAGLVIQPSEFGYVDPRGISVLIPDHYLWWQRLADDSYSRGGRPAVVKASAEAMRDLIQDGFPDDAEVVHFFFG